MSETRKIAAILVADVVGFSRLAGADEDRTLARLRGLRSDLIDPAIAAHHGRIVKRTGDGSIIEFRSVVDAVRCAIEVQQGLIERNAGVSEDRRIEFRVGIHLGDVVEEADGDLMGDGVNVAARLEGIAKPGAICLSEQAYWQVKGRLDLAVTDLGPTELKNIAEPIRVYSLQVGVPAQAKQAKPAKPAEPVTPAAPTPQKRRFGLAPLAAALAALLGCDRGRRVVVPQCEPARKRRCERARRGRASFDSRAALRQSVGRSGAGLPRRRPDRRTDNQSRAHARHFRHRAQYGHDLQGQADRRQGDRQDLGVRYVLEGSVQPSGDRMRVNAQLIDAGSGAHLWAEQFDTPRADLLQTQDAIVTHLAGAMAFQLTQAEAARLKQKPAANRDAEDLALQCNAGAWKALSLGKEADAAFALCEQALAIDPNNVLALMALGFKFLARAQAGVSGDPKGDLERADELASKALALDPDWSVNHELKGSILRFQARYQEAAAEHERALGKAGAGREGKGVESSA
jgi:adenylate cyclase